MGLRRVCLKQSQPGSIFSPYDVDMFSFCELVWAAICTIGRVAHIDKYAKRKYTLVMFEIFAKIIS